MAKYRLRAHKRSDDDSEVEIVEDRSGAWFVRKPGDPNLGRMPMGAFVSRQAARQWADQRFAGGEWSDAVV